MTSPSPRKPWASAIRALVTVASLALAVWAVAHLLEGEDFRDVTVRLRRASPAGVLLASGFVLLHLFLWAFRWKLAIRRIDPTPRRRVIYSALAAAASVNLVAPFARVLGGLLRARYLARDGRRTLGEFLGVVLFDQWMHGVVMGLLTAGALIFSAAVGHRYELAASLAIGILAMAFALHLWSLMRTRDAAAWAARFAESSWAGRWPLRALKRHGQDTLATFSKLLSDDRLRLASWALGLGVFFAAASAQAAAFWALGETPRPLVVCVTVALGAAVGTLATTPGGVGVTEASMIALFVWLGVDRVTAAAAALLYRSVYYVVVLVTGMPSLLVLEWAQIRDRRRARRP
jgi:undecaprenyl-diphosphatase